MAIAFDAATEFDHAAATSETFAHTCSASATMILVTNRGSGDVIPDTITYDGDSLASVRAGAAAAVGINIWGLGVGVNTGTHNVVISYPSSITNAGAALSYEGTDTTDPFGASLASDSGTSSTSYSVELTTDTANSWIVDYIATTTSAATTNFAPDGSQIERFSIVPPVNSPVEVAGSDLVTTTAGGYTTGWTWTTNSRAFLLQLEIHAASSTAHTILATETATLSDTLAQTFSAHLAQTENLTLSDTVLTAAQFGQTIAEQIGLSDSAEAEILIAISFTEELGLSDNVSEQTTYGVILTDQANLSDLLQVIADRVTVVEIVTLSDDVDLALTLGVVVTETLGLTDVVSLTKSGWSFRTKHDTSWSNRTKNTTVWTFRDKNSSQG